MQNERCETCFKLRPASEITTHKGARVCIAHVASGAPRPVKAPATAPERTQSRLARCEHCYKLALASLMQTVNDDSICPECAKPEKQWYAIALVGPEARIIKDVRKRAAKRGLSHMLGRIVSPRVREARTTRDLYEAIGPDGRVVGTMTAESEEDALHQARIKFTPKSQKGVYKPEPSDIFVPVLDKVEKVKETTIEKGKRIRRTVYVALDQSGKVLGRILECKSPKRAQEVATRLYGPKDKPVTHVPPVVGQIDEVRLAREGGNVKVSNRKAMKGYLLVECEKNDHIFYCLKETPGVYAVLPFTEKVTFEQIERYGLPDYPSSLTDEEIEKHTVNPKARPMQVTYNLGDFIEIVNGPYTGQKTKVTEVVNETTVKCEVTVLGRPITVLQSVLNVRKA